MDRTYFILGAVASTGAYIDRTRVVRCQGPLSVGCSQFQYARGVVNISRKFGVSDIYKVPVPDGYALTTQRPR